MSCPICLDDINENKKIVLDCSHEFCEDCILDNLTKLSSCPLCRRDIIFEYNGEKICNHKNPKKRITSHYLSRLISFIKLLLENILYYLMFIMIIIIQFISLIIILSAMLFCMNTKSDLLVFYLFGCFIIVTICSKLVNDTTQLLYEHPLSLM